MRLGVRKRMVHALAALAAVLLTLAPSLDSAAHAASVAVSAGDHSIGTRILSAFDVIDDVLDHLPGNNQTFQQQVIPPASQPQQTEMGAAPVVEPPQWQSPADEHLDSFVLNRIKRPPRT